MKLSKNPVFLHYFSKFMGILLFVLKYMYISLFLKMINGFFWPVKIMVSNFKVWKTIPLEKNKQKNKTKTNKQNKTNVLWTLCVTIFII